MTEIESNVALPAAEAAPKKSRGGGRKKASTPANSPVASLIDALKFVATIAKKAGTPGQQFANVHDHCLVVCDGVVTIGTRITEDLSACPHTLQFLDALQRCGKDVAITQLSPNAIAVTSGDYRAVIPCVAHADVPYFPPDPSLAPCTDKLREAIEIVAPLPQEGAPLARNAGVLVQAQTVVGMSGPALLEAFHGVDMPPGMLLPKPAAAALVKIGKKLASFGFQWGQNANIVSLTFWFEDGSFLKSQLFGEPYPNYGHLFDTGEAQPWTVPTEFYTAVKAVESFNSRGIVYFDGDKLSSHSHGTEEMTTYRLPGVPEGMAFAAKLLLAAEPYFKTAIFVKEGTDTRAVFYGQNVRGVIAGIKMSQAPDTQATPADVEASRKRVEEYRAQHNDWANPIPDDDIPF